MSNKTSKILMVGVLLITSLAFVGTANASWFSDWYNVYFGKKTSVTTVSDQPSVGARTSNYWDEIAGSYMRPNYPSGEGLLIYGSNKYINFGSTYGTNGYGVRDNSGTIECKNNGGSWGACGSGSGGSGGGLNIQGSVSIGQIPYFNTTATSTAVATSTSLVTCTGSTSCGSGSYVIGNPLTITSTAGGSGTISTSSPLTAGLLVQSTAWNTIANIATNTLNIALSDTMGTLAVNRGGTGLTSGYNNSNWDTAYTNASTSLYSIFTTQASSTATYQLKGSYLTSYDAFTHPSANQSATTSLMLFNGNATSTGLTVTGSTYLATTGGNVGIGNTAPAYTLDIKGTAGATNLFNVASSTGTSLMVINKDGNVGIGTTSPVAKLDVWGSVRVTQNSTGYSEFTHANASANSAYPRSYFRIYGNGSESNSALYVAPGNAIGATQQPVFLGLSTNADVKQASSKQMLVYLTTSALSFVTNDAETSGGAKIPWYLGGTQLNGSDSSLALLATGNVGIGTTSPASKLDVNGTLTIEGTKNAACLSTDNNGLVSATTCGAGSQTPWTSTISGADYSLSGAGFIDTNKFSGFTQDSNLLVYASSTNKDTILGLGAGGQNATTSATARYVTAIGYQSLNSNTTGSGNTAVGAYSLLSNKTSNFNTAVGFYSLNGNTGANNTSLGYNTMRLNTDGGFNTALGLLALYNNLTGSGNISIGVNSLNGTNATSTTYNIAIGYDAGFDITSNGISSKGSNNIAIGNYVDMASNTGSNQLNVGNIIYGTGLYSGTSMSNTPTGGLVGIGTTSPATALDVNGTLTIEGTKNASCLSTDNNGLVGSATCLSTIGSGTNGQLAWWSGTNSLTGVSTSTPSFNYSFTPGGTWTVLGSSPTLGVATSSLYTGSTNQLMYFTGTNALGGLTAGSNGNVLITSASVPTWFATSSPTFGLGLTKGGTWGTLGVSPTLNIATSSLFTGATNQVAYFTGTNALGGLTAGSNGQVLGMSAGTLSWVATSSGTTYTGNYPISVSGSAISLSGMATSTITCSGSVSCGAGSYVVGSPLTITGSGGGGGAGLQVGGASAPLGGIPYFNSTATSTAMATSTITIDTSTSQLTLGSGNEVMRISSSGNVGIGTTTPDYLLTIYGTSSTTIAYIGRLTLSTPLSVTNGGTGIGYAGGFQSGAIPFGNGASPFATSSSLQFTNSSQNLLVGSSTSLTSWQEPIAAAGNVSGSYVGITSINLGTGDGSSEDFLFNGDKTDATNFYYLADIGRANHINSGGVGYAILNTPDESYWYNTDSNITIFTATSSSAGYIEFGTGGTATTNERMRILSTGLVGIATTTPQYPLSVYSNTKPQLSLSAGGKYSQWTLRDSNGTFYLATTTTAGTATSTNGFNPFTILNTGQVGIGTSTPFGLFSIEALSSPPNLLLSVSSSSAANSITPVLSVDKNGHQIVSGATPTVSNCGTSPSITGNDVAGKITAGTASPVTCTLTFSNTFGTAPACMVVGSPAAGSSYFGQLLSSTTATTLNFMDKATTTGDTWVPITSYVFSYHCLGTQ